MTAADADRTARLGLGALVLCTAVFLGVWGWAWAALPPDGVVHHIGLDGPDRTGTRGGILWPLLLLGPPLMLGIRWLIAVVVRTGDGTGLNYPHKAYWLAPERRDAFRRRVVGELDLVWGATLLLLAGGLVEVVRVTEDRDAPSVMFPTLGVYLAFVGWWMWWIVSRSRPPRRP
ncbi:hypothetical protein [Ornithinimicrobium pekingense]|uniref:DUF1648 domain-containing protein n=1 Tax=Ornithinimicrobium pekingense TaxID=384677 RepID=A0ABQ2FAW1_9MICO|nr:hypothetical protein [Ornithinimicrobium pekingense]GGK75604.1 hypothetical protein GCM10011509_25360 [Ornithinimicrobium pekingense]